MSWEAESWARQQRTGDPVTKAVLVGIANWMNPKGDECQVSLRRLADEVEVSVRTVQRHIARLEEIGLLSKHTAQRDDGGQGWNCFTFPTYKPPKVSHVEPSKRSNPRDKMSSPPRQIVMGGDDQNGTAPHDNLTPGGVANRRGEGDNGVTPERGKGLDKTPPAPPAGGRNRGERIAADWQPPAIADLPPAAKAKARQWPSGAYEAEAEAFRDYWLGEGRAGARKLDWNRTWFNRINESTARVLRDAKAGVKYASTTAARSDAPPPAALDTSRETQPAKAIRVHLARRLGESAMNQWFKGSRLDVSEGTLTIVAPSAFASTYQRNNFADDAGRAMHAVLGPDADLQWRVEKPPAA